MTAPNNLLAADEPPAYLEENLAGRGDFLITVDHASARIPRRLNFLGVSAQELTRHIAWDIGALGLARHMSQHLDAPLIASGYSRLVIDCNRDPRVPSAIPEISEYTDIPGNVGLSEEARAARVAALFTPYQTRIGELIDQRTAAGRRTVLISQHTMTPVYKGQQREMHAAVLYNRDRRLAHALLHALRADRAVTIAENEPYFVSDETDYTVPVHAERRGLLHVEIEVRQDLVTTPEGQAAWAKRLCDALLIADRHCRGV